MLYTFAVTGTFQNMLLIKPMSLSQRGRNVITFNNGSGIAEGGDYLHNIPSEAQKFNVVQLLISATSAPTFGNTLLAAGVFKLT